jgi:hypothetical protein
MSCTQFHCIKMFILRHAWLNLFRVSDKFPYQPRLYLSYLLLQIATYI